MITLPLPASPESLFLENLRARTAASHKRLEQLPISSVILQPAVSREAYAKYLTAMYDVAKSVEESVDPKLSGVIPDIGQRAKAYKLENDLKFIGFAVPEARTDVFANEIASTAFALGIFYVVEGSTLGGRFILKNVDASLGYNESEGASYFAGYGNKTGSSWKSFLDSLTAFAIENDATDEVIAGATFAFDKIHEHLSSRS